MRILAGAWWLAGCVSDAEIAAEMERALGDASEAMVEVLVSTEVLDQVDDPPDVTLRDVRHGGDACGCPCTERLGGGIPYVLTLDYSQYGCVPASGLVPSAITGHAVLDYDGQDCRVTWDGLQLSLEHDVTGELGGEVSGGVVAAAGDLAIGPRDAGIDLSVEVGEDGLTIDGEVTASGADPRPIRFEGVNLPRSAVAGRCPTPDAGTATLVDADHPDRSAVIRFGPGGAVTVERGDRVSEDTDWCSYASPRW
ncbi:MAG: hypothetical protein ABMB14_21345 [Myxococcota bacterium]